MESMDSSSEPVHQRRIDTATLIVIALLAVALLWRVVFFLEMYTSPYGDTLSLDSEVYHEAALEVANGRWSPGETFFQAPLYPWALGVVYAVFGPSQTFAKSLQILLSVASCWLIYRMAERTFDQTIARTALAIAAVYGTYMYFANELLAVTLLVFLDLLGLDILLVAVEGERQWLWVTAGLVFGISAIARPTILPFVAAVGLWVVISGGRSQRLKPAMSSTLLFAAGVAIPILPVTVHNYLADGDFVLIASNGGFNFFIGNNPRSDGITAVAPGLRADRRGAQADQDRIAREALGDPEATPKDVSDFWYTRGWKWIIEEPVAAFRHVARKSLYLINAHEVSNNRVIEFVTRHSSIFSRATIRFWMILPLAVAGIVIGGGRGRQKTLLLLFVVVYSATVVSFFVNSRFRMPMVAVLIVFAAAAVVAWFRWLRSRPLDRQIGMRVFVSVLAAVATAVLIRPLPALEVADAQAFFNEAEAYRAQGDYAGAARWYRSALEAFPGYCDAAYNLARIHAEIQPDPYRVIEVLEPVSDACAEDEALQDLLIHARSAVEPRGEDGRQTDSGVRSDDL